ncbi:glycosyltransferase family 2 protein [Streptomyces yaizuensis]|uniref:Glycosyltransferase family 2 protein n=1 Tax=Streptomyces yaizuensis TaxID=2989713 RepID=A0ABQ5P3R7_9ACTN|nr:glycosyltransferase family 2 protein [Streptomyces sp. YSPA8]GLF97227.1 glycosyltransferase family 2 protein [Streptomyces sp. YSPA8]
MSQISIVVPCFNESEVIETFHTTLVGVLEPTGREYEICYVDDGSSDHTRAHLQELASADRRTRYTSFSRNFGKESAMLAGLRMSRGEAVVLMDADLQHPPGLIPRMLELQGHGYDQVVAQRDRSGDGMVRTMLSQAYYRLVRRFMDVEVVDGAGDFRLLSRRAVNALLSLPESNRFSKGMFSWIGFDTVTFQYENVQRAAGQSKWGGRRLLNYGIDGLLSFNSRPLRMAIHGGLWLFLSALAYALWIIVNVLVDGVDTPGYATLVAVIIGMSGVQIATLGIIGEYVGRIYHEAKRRPHYVVRETSGAGGAGGTGGNGDLGEDGRTGGAAADDRLPTGTTGATSPGTAGPGTGDQQLALPDSALAGPPGRRTGKGQW